MSQSHMRIRPARNRRTTEKVMVAVEADVMVWMDWRKAAGAKLDVVRLV